MTRRGFLLLAAGALLLPRDVRAQQATRRRIAFLATGSPAQADPNIGTFRQGLCALGYGDEGIAIEIGYADGKVERLPDTGASRPGSPPGRGDPDGPGFEGGDLDDPDRHGGFRRPGWRRIGR